MPEPLLAELPEDQATGTVAAIYDEIRRFSGVPYVSSLQRYLATMPGVLEWAWAAIRPAMVSGVVPETGWRLADHARLTPLDPVPEAARAAWQLDMSNYATIRSIAKNFVRVSPVNLMTGACLKCLLTGQQAGGAGISDNWTPPAMLAPMPGNADPLALAPDRRAVLMRFATEVDSAPFIPALYRQLAMFPAFLEWLAGELVPRLTAPETNLARAAFRVAAMEAAPAIVARLPRTPLPPAPGPETARRVLTIIDRYAETSPEMTMFGRLILDAI
ncbi:MAG: hypothetical protein EXR07_11425 [Acetobacteraceae bacterium]|nr:hypothetical protein [Acetobacteraceae bacterium]